MATGDIANNIRKMRSRLKEIKCTEDFDVNTLAEGQPAAYLPIYHYAFTNYSQPLAQLILDKGIELFGKSDARFMEAVYKILRDVFAYKPPITKEQFFAKGFSERKVIMCTEIIQLVKKKHMELKPAPPKTSMKTSVRPKSAPETKHLPLAVPKTQPETARVSPRDPIRHMQRHTAPQVVSELTSMPASEPVRHLSSSASHPHPVRHVAGHESLNSSESSDQSESIPRSILSGYDSRIRSVAKHVSIQSPREAILTPLRQRMPQLPWKFEETPDRSNHVKTDFMTPSIKKVCTKSVEVVVMPKGQYDEDRDGDTSIVEIRAPTGDSLLQSPAPTSNIDIASLYQTVETLTGQVMQLAQRQQSAGNVGTDEKMDTVLSKIENVTARILLLENRMSIIEAKMGEVQLTTPPVPMYSTPGTATVSQPSMQLPRVEPVAKDTIQTEVESAKHVYSRNVGQGDISVDSPGLFSGPGNSFAEELKAISDSQKAKIKENGDFSLNYSPIRRVNNGLAGTIVSANEDTFAMETEDDARRSSTPTFGGTFLGESSLHCDLSHMETKDTVARIHDMMKETKLMIKDIGAGGTLQPPEVDIGS